MPDRNPPPPLPQPGAQGAEGEPGTAEGIGGDGGHGGRGGRGGIGLTGATGDTGPRGRPGTATRGAKGEPGAPQTRTAQVALAVVVLACALSAIYFSTQANNRLDDAVTARQSLADDQSQFDQQVTCSLDVLEETLNAVRARASFAEQQAETTLAGDRAQRRYLLALSDPDRPDSDTAQLTDDYLTALQFKITATDEQLKVAEANPFPTLPDVASCNP